MEEIKIIPLSKAASFQLGWSRQETHEKVRKSNSTHGRTEYYENPSCSVHYNEDDKIEYIEISNPKTNDIKITLQGLDVFRTPANELLTKIKNVTGLDFDKDDPEIPYSFIFPDLELSFWRQVLPENENDEDGKYFDTVGIGKPGYYSQ